MRTFLISLVVSASVLAFSAGTAGAAPIAPEHHTAAIYAPQEDTEEHDKDLPWPIFLAGAFVVPLAVLLGGAFLFPKKEPESHVEG